MSSPKPRRSVRPEARARTKARGDTAAPARQAVLYARVSSREQEQQGFSIPAQQELLRTYAATHGYTIVEEFVDVETAKKTGRGSFTRMVAFLRKRREPRPVILVEKTDRLYRNLKDWVLLDEMNVDIHLVKEGVILSDESRSSEKFVHGIKVLMAKNYVDNLSEEVRKGMHQKAREGHWPSSAPFGYLNERRDGRSFIVADPERALLVRNLFEQYDTGEHSMETLAAYIDRLGVRGRRGGKLHAATIHLMLRNPLYAGQFYWGGQLYTGRDPKLVSWELFERVQARLDGHPYTRASEHTFAYSGLVTCGLCGHAYTAEVKKNIYVYYRCAKNCVRGMKYVPERRMTELIGLHVAKLCFPPALRDHVIDALKSSRRLVADETRVRIAEATQRMERLSRVIDKAYEDNGGGAVWVKEYSWAPTSCDPCTAGGPLDEGTLRDLGFEGDPNTANVTRLHVRFDPGAVSEDLMLYPRNHNPNWQQRYISYDKALESDFPICEKGWLEDPGTCEADTGADAGWSGGLPAGWLLAGAAAFGLSRRRRA